MKLFELLIKIKTNNDFKKQLVNQSSGNDFENKIKELLENSNSYSSYSSSNFKQHINFKKIKEKILNKMSNENCIKNELVKDICQYESKFIYQPFGSQMFPDFLLIRKEYLIPLEIKYSNKKGDRPIWNSNIPHSFGIYIFGSKINDDITFYFGKDLLSYDEIKEMLFLAKKYKKELMDQSKKISKNKFELYLRPMFNQKFSILKSNKRSIYEDNTIKFLKNIEK